MCGLPYFLIGNLIQKNKEKLTKSITNNKLIFLIILFTITTLIEKYILIRLNANTIRDHYISTTFLSIFMFICFIKIPMVKSDNLLAIIGQKYSLHIYIVHFMFVKLYNMYVVNEIFNYLIQIIIFVTSLLVSILYVKVKNILTKNDIKLLR